MKKKILLIALFMAVSVASFQLSSKREKMDDLMYLYVVAFWRNFCI